MNKPVTWTEADNKSHRFDAFHDTLQSVLNKQKAKEDDIEDDFKDDDDED